MSSHHAAHKWLLAMCWLFVVVHIWFASDDSDVIMDASFGEPKREARVTNIQQHRTDEEASYDIAWEPMPNGLREMSIIAEDEGMEEFGAESNENSDLFDAKHLGREIQDLREFQWTPGTEEEIENGSTSTDEIPTKSVTNILADAIRDTAQEIYNKTANKLLSNETSGTLQSNILVQALQPITSKECCIPAIYDGPTNPKDVACFGTCFNERACNDTTYPFNSIEEKEMLVMTDLSKEGRQILRPECKSPDKLVPPVEWCQKPHVGAKNETAAHLVNGIPPAGCSSITNGGGSGAFQHVIIFPSAKLAFCGIPKVGITQWEQFLRFYLGAKDYPSLPHYKMDRKPFQFDKLDPKVQRQIWEDEEWTWAALIRNPAERLLSAYLDKVKSKKEFKWLDGKMSFEEFIDKLSKPQNSSNCNDVKGVIEGLDWCSDPHWRPQVYSCGLSERLDRFQFIGDLHYAADHTRELLSNVGLWESHGRHFINGGVRVGRNPWCTISSHPANHTFHVGFQQKEEVSNSTAAQVEYGHAKGSKGKMETYFTPELLEKVQEELYADDYKLWKLVNDNGQKLSKGKELMPQLSRKCAKIPIGATSIYQ